MTAFFRAVRGRSVRTVIAAAALTFAGTSAAIAETYFVDCVNGDDSWDGKSVFWNGGNHGPKQTIRAGLSVAGWGDEVSVADGVYTGDGNNSLSYGGKAINLHSRRGPGTTIIDLDLLTKPAVSFLQGEPGGAVLDGFTITHCRAC